MQPLRIPTSFQLFGQTITVRYDPTLVHETDCVGSSRYRHNTILIQPSQAGQDRLQSQIEQTFCHELVHYILRFLNEDDLNKSEKFVDLFAGLLHQTFTTMTYEG